MPYIDLELSKALAIVTEGVLDMERDLTAIKGKDLTEEERTSVQEPYLGPTVLMAAHEPYAVIRMEDVWVEGTILSEDEKKVVSRAIEMLAYPHRFIERES